MASSDKFGPGWFRTAMRLIFGEGGISQSANVAPAASLTSIDLDPALGTPDAEGDLVQLTGADAGQDNNNATIAAQFNALRADVAELRTQFNAKLAADEAANLQADS